jgi:hypothetical protein
MPHNSLLHNQITETVTLTDPVEVTLFVSSASINRLSKTLRHIHRRAEKDEVQDIRNKANASMVNELLQGLRYRVRKLWAMMLQKRERLLTSKALPVG